MRRSRKLILIINIYILIYKIKTNKKVIIININKKLSFEAVVV